MSTTQTISVYKGIETQVRVRAPGKWDSLTNYTFNSSSNTLSVTTNTYNGLSMQDITGYNTADVLDFSSAVLPWKFEYNSSLATSRYCLMPVLTDSLGNIIPYQNVVPTDFTYNFDIYGSLHIDNPVMVGLCSGFSLDDFIQSKTTNPLDTGKTFKFKIITDSDIQSTQLLLKQSRYHAMSISNSNLTTYNYQTSQEEIVTSLSANTNYWIKIEFLSTSKIISISTDGINYIDYTINDNVYATLGATNYLCIGGKLNEGYFKGAIALRETSIEESGIITWEAITVSGGGTPENLYGCLVNTTDVDYSRALDCYVIDNDQRIVLTDDENYNDGYYLGTVMLPYHTVYEYNNGTWTEQSQGGSEGLFPPGFEFEF